MAHADRLYFTYLRGIPQSPPNQIQLNLAYQ